LAPLVELIFDGDARLQALAARSLAHLALDRTAASDIQRAGGVYAAITLLSSVLKKQLFICWYFLVLNDQYCTGKCRSVG
jgi:hypothetical protein